MRISATSILIAPLLLLGCSYTPATKAPEPVSVKPQPARPKQSTHARKARDPASVKLQPVSPKRFWFDYQFEPAPGKRNWTKPDHNTWIEEYENGVSSRFKITGHETVEGTSGTVVTKIDGNPEKTQTGNEGNFQVFIPDLGSAYMRLWCRNKLNDGWEKWKFLNEMHGVE